MTQKEVKVHMKPEIVLYQSEIAQNMGAVARTCAAFGINMHVVEPLGFVWNAPKMRRSGMDYLDLAAITRHMSWQHFMAQKPAHQRLVVMTKFAEETLDKFTFKPGDMLVMGRESSGVDEEVLNDADAQVKIPMVADARSLNVAQSAGMAAFEACRQLNCLPV